MKYFFILFVFIALLIASFKAGQKSYSDEKARDLYFNLSIYMRSYQELKNAESIEDIDAPKDLLLLTSLSIVGYLQNNPRLIKKLESHSVPIEERMARVLNYVNEEKATALRHQPAGGNQVDDS